jgi:hypothetical protein
MGPSGRRVPFADGDDGRGSVPDRPLAPHGRTSAVAFAAASTVAVAVGADVIAGEPVAHVAALGLVALVVGIARLRSGGDRGGFFAALSGALVAQPALHAAAALLPAATALRPGSPAAIGPVVSAAAVVLAVAGAERLFLLAAGAGAFGRWLVALLRSPAPPHPAPLRRPVRTAARTALRPTAVAPRRGPPVAAAAAA